MWIRYQSDPHCENILVLLSLRVWTRYQRPAVTGGRLLLSSRADVCSSGAPPGLPCTEEDQEEHSQSPTKPPPAGHPCARGPSILCAGVAWKSQSCCLALLHHCDAASISSENTDRIKHPAVQAPKILRLTL